MQVLGFFVSFLKAISLKLSRQTSQFLINVGDCGDLSFPLYTEAIKFAHHKEGMVRACCRTMTLNIFSVGDPYIDAFVTHPPSTKYLTDLSSYLARNIKVLMGFGDSNMQLELFIADSAVSGRHVTWRVSKRF
jgi:hypothetical protein